MPTVSPPASLGDEKGTRYRIVADERPLPNNRKEIVSAVESILSLGQVQKVVVELHKPIKFFRAVVGDTDEIPKEILDDEEFANVRNAEIKEFLNDPKWNMSFFEFLFRAFQFLTQERLKARSFLVSGAGLRSFKKALGLGPQASISEVFGVGVIQSDEIPPDVLLLSSTRHGEEEIHLSLRMLFPKDTK